MHRFLIAFVLTALLALGCSAQQSAAAAPVKPPVGIEGPVIGGDGTANYIAIWRTPNYLQSSVIYQTGGSIGIGTTSPQATLDVNGNINSTRGYFSINGLPSLKADMWNVLLGFETGGANMTGVANTYVGVAAGYNTTSGTGNSFVGYGSGLANTSGSYDTFLGESTGSANTTGGNNTFAGFYTGYSNVTGNNDTFAGAFAGEYNTNGFGNVFSGALAGQSNTTGSYNVFDGLEAGVNSTIGNNNVFIGYYSGFNNNSGSYDIYIGSQGSQGGSEVGAIRIGDSSSQAAAYIAGIYGTAVSGVPGYVNASGQLGVQTSSQRFKQDVRDMGDSTSGLMRLRPVTFVYKPEYANGDGTLQYGLMAEEVAKVYPQLVAYDSDGNPYSVRYQYLSTMLLNEYQKEHRVVEQQAADLVGLRDRVATQELEIRRLQEQLQMQTVELQERVTRLEHQTIASSQIVANK